MADVGESLDFDFFETPRTPDETVMPPVSRSKPPARPQSAKHPKSPIRSTEYKSRSPSLSSRDSSLDRSISDLSELSAPREKATRGRNSERSPSVSSFSSSDCSRSRSRSVSKSDASSRSASNNSIDNRKYSKYSDSEDDRKSPKYIGTKTTDMPKRGPSILRDDEYSSSAYSDDDYDDSEKLKKPPPNKNSDSFGKRADKSSDCGSKKHAWGEDSRGKVTKSRSNLQRVRPMTAKSRPRDRNGGQRSRSDSDALSDSDMTDVSPIDSPRHGLSRPDDTGGSRLKFRPMPVSNSHLEVEASDYTEKHKKGALDLEILMKAVGELEKQKRLKANSRRVMFAPMTLKRSDKSNYTFDKNQARDIERENQRLLKEIVQQVHANERKQQYRSSPASVYKLTASAVNRDREMKRIENENMALLKRLQKVKPTKTISRDNQIHSYESTQLHGVPIGTLHPMPRKNKTRTRRSIMDDTSSIGRSSIGSRTRSMTSIHSGASSVRSRPNSRPCSATKRLDTRPIWSDRW